jgi:zinc protease
MTSVAAEVLTSRTLPNGARILCLPSASDPGGAVAIQLWVASGTAAERAEEHGCAHLLEHMLFKPRGADRSSGDLARAIETLGGDVNAFTSHDETVIYATVPAAGWHGAMSALLDAALTPRLDAGELAREIEVVVEEIKQYDDEPGQRAGQALMSMVHRGHAYARPVLGLAKEVRSHGARRLRGFHRRAYAGTRLTLVVVGPVTTAEVLAAARGRLGAAARAAGRADRPSVGSAPGGRVRLRREDVHEAQIMFGWPTPGLGDPALAALDVAALVLGHGDAARLVRETRRRDQLVTDVHAHLDVAREAGTFVISARTTSDKLAASGAAIAAQVARLASRSVSGEELARARTVLESDRIYRRETAQGQAHAIGYYAALAGDPGLEEAYFQALRAVDVESVREAIAARLVPVEAQIVAVVPQEEVTAAELPGLRRSLAEIGRAPPRRSRPAGKDGLVAAELACGLKIFAAVDRRVPVTASWLAWPGGLIGEPAALAGRAAMLATLLTRGHARADGDTISREIDGMAASLEGFAGRSCLGIHGESLARHLPRVLEEMVECALTPSFPQDELEEERRVALEDLTADEDDLGQVALRAMRGLLFGDHPFSRDLRGTKAGLRAIQRADLIATMKQSYGLGGGVLALAGDVDVEAAIEVIEARLAGVGKPGRAGGKRGKSGEREAPAWPTRARQRLLHREREQAHVAMGFPGLTVADPRVPTMEVLMMVLGGQSGRLFHALREEEGLVYQVDASSHEGASAGHVTLYASTSQAKLGRALAALELHVARIRERAAASEELARAKATLIGQHRIGLQRRSRIASAIASAVIFGLPADHFRGYDERIRAVTAEEVLALAGEIFAPSRRALGIVRDRTSATFG